MSALFTLVRPLLHAMDAETAHTATIAALRSGAVPAAAPARHARELCVQAMGLQFPNPVGLAAGFDKNAAVPDAMLAQGFGFVEVGSVTPRPQSGNPRPRLFRLTEDQAVINRMGFNNDGLDALVRRLARRRGRPGIVGVNLGANKDSADRIADYVAGIARVAAFADYITVNVSSPNTPGLRDLQSKSGLGDLIARVNDARHTARGDAASPVPLAVKIAPDLDPGELADIAGVCLDRAVDAIIVSNTTLTRPGLRSPLAGEQGGLSGSPLFELSTMQLARMYACTQGRIVLIGAGGISSAETAWQKVLAGASLLQLYSALVYEGPGLVRQINEGLARRLRDGGFRTLADAVGTGHERWIDRET